jgi:large subunit ribosomal protein L15
MKLNQLIKTIDKPSKRIGRGLGSGKGKTGGKGQKGQKVRGTIPQGFIGGTMPLYKKLPYRRGYHRDGIHQSSSLAKKMKPLNLDDLKTLKPKSEVTFQTLLEAKIITQKDVLVGVKILGDGDIKNALTVKLPVSKSAQKKIEAAGGKIENA